MPSSGGEEVDENVCGVLQGLALGVPLEAGSIIDDEGSSESRTPTFTGATVLAVIRTGNDSWVWAHRSWFRPGNHPTLWPDR